MGQCVTVVFDGDTAARSIHDDGLDFALCRQAIHQRPPGVDVAAHVRQAAWHVGQVRANSAAAAGPVSHQGLDARSVQHPRCGAVDVGHHAGLHTAQKHQHFAWVFACGPLVGTHAALGGYLVFQHLGQKRTHQLPQFHGRAKERRCQTHFERATQQPFAGRAFNTLFHQLATNVNQLAIFHAAGAGAFAVAAGQTAVQVQLGLACGRNAFQHLFDEVDAATRAVQFVAQQLIRGAGGGAKTAVHTLAQDGFGGLPVGRAFELGAEVGLHPVSVNQASS